MEITDRLHEQSNLFTCVNNRMPTVLIMNPELCKKAQIEINKRVIGTPIFDLNDKTSSLKFMGIRVVRSEDVKEFEFH